MDELAFAGRFWGMNWSSGSINAIEKGAFKPTLETLAALALALGELHNSDAVPVSELLKSSTDIYLTEIMLLTPKGLTSWLEGGQIDTFYNAAAFFEVESTLNEEVERMKSLRWPPGVPVTSPTSSPSPGEIRLAKKIDLDPVELQVWSTFVFGKPFEAHRDELAGEGATPQKKGRIARKLLEQITDAMNEPDHGSD